MMVGLPLQVSESQDGSVLGKEPAAKAMRAQKGQEAWKIRASRAPLPPAAARRRSQADAAPSAPAAHPAQSPTEVNSHLFTTTPFVPSLRLLVSRCCCVEMLQCTGMSQCSQQRCHSNPKVLVAKVLVSRSDRTIFAAYVDRCLSLKRLRAFHGLP